MKLKSLYLLFILLLGFDQVRAQECGIIYVIPSGATSGVAGTRANPADLLYGVSLVSATDTIVWLADGTYPISNTLSIPNGATIEGTFDPTTWVKTNANTSTIARDALNPDMANLSLIALEGNGIANFRLQDINITVAAAPATQITVYGIRLTSCSSYNITRCTVTTGAGGNGTDGSLGANGVIGANASDGIQGDDDNIITICGGAGGAGGGAGAGGAGAGGCTDGNPGGAGGTPTSQCAGGGGGGGGGGGQNDNDGGNGGTGGGWTSANTGVGSGGNSSGGCNSTSNCSDQTTGGPGSNGGNGAIGTLGTTGTPGTNAGGYFIVGVAGGIGICGTGGQGGTGGGAGAGEGNIFCSNGTGSTGAGGGGGGEGGQGGTGGTGGGGSFCIYLFANGSGGIVQDCDLNPGAGGVGGIGGPGGTGGSGGFGGVGQPWFDSDLGCSGDGGAGGAGGAGGTGGSGAAGTSLQIYEHPGGVLVSQLGIDAVPGNPPIISVLNPGCAFSEVIFTATSSGTWNFGAGANPATANGAGPFSVTYSTLGRKTIIFAGTTFTEYVHIFNLGISGTFISPQDTTVVLGCPETFTSTLVGTYYEWWFSGGTTPDTLADSTFQTIDSVFFTVPGVYTLILKVTTGDSCCGVAFDTTTITVDTSAFSLSMTSSLDTICQGDTMIFTASGAYGSYEFFVNDTSVQNSASNVYTTTTLSPGDSVVVIALSGSCYTNPSDTLTPTVLPVPNATLLSDDPDNIICGGDTVVFTANPSGYASYDFQVNGVSQQLGVSNLFSTNTLVDGDSIMVVVPGLGCGGPSSNTIVMTVQAPPVITLLSSDPDTTICTGETITFTVTPAAQPFYGFFYNTLLVQSGTSNTYVASGIVDGDMIFAAASSAAGCIGLTDSMYITVIPIPTVSILNTLDTICINYANTFSASPGGLDNYEFFINGVSFISGSSSIFTTTALQDGDQVSVIGTNLGCSSTPDTSIAITVITGPTVSIISSPSSICSGDSITVTASPAGYTSYEFFIGNTSVQNSASNILVTAGVNNGDSITVFASDNVCPGPQSNVVVVVVDIPVVTATSSDTTICAGDVVVVTATPGGNANYDFILNGSSVQSSASNMYTTSTLNNGDQIEVIATSPNVCLGIPSGTITFIVNPIPVVSIAADTNTICLADLLQFTATPAGLNSYIFYVNGTAVQVSSSNTYQTNGILDGDLISVVGENLGCNSAADTTGPITVISGPTITVASDDPDNTICAGDPITFTASPGGYANYEFVIDGVVVQSGTGTTYTTSTLPAGAIVEVTASDIICPGPLVTVTAVTVNPIPATTITSPTPTICAGDPITFTATVSGYDNYEFFVNGTSVQSGSSNTYSSSAINNLDTIYIVPTHFNCLGIALDSIIAVVNPNPAISFINDTVCIGEVSTFIIDVSDPNISTFFWDYGDGTSGPDGSNTYTDTGTYVVSLTVTDLLGCDSTALGVAQINPLPVAEASANPMITTILNPKIAFTDASDPPVPASIISWLWTFDDGGSDTTQNPIHEYLDTGTYVVGLSVTNEFGCQDDDLVAVVIEPEFTLHPPNSFTPNQDDFNETFIPQGIGLEDDFVMYIYNRWGDLIFESNSVDDPWDGTVNGKGEAQQDVYVWVVYVSDYKKTRHHFVGHVTLIR